MLASRLYDNFKDLTQDQKDYAIGWFFAVVGMPIDGFTDAKEKPEHLPALYALEKMAEAILQAERRA